MSSARTAAVSESPSAPRSVNEGSITAGCQGQRYSAPAWRSASAGSIAIGTVVEPQRQLFRHNDLSPNRWNAAEYRGFQQTNFVPPSITDRGADGDNLPLGELPVDLLRCTQAMAGALRAFLERSVFDWMSFS